MKRFPYLNSNIILLAIISLLNDLSSELLYPIIPLYLATLGATPIFMGAVEGIAEIINAFLKLNSGYWSDRVGKRKPFITWGYGLSALGKLLLGLTTGIYSVFAARAIDRFGKGLRSPARDALLHDASPEGKSGAVFGFHRSADTIGAVAGPLVALILLRYLNWSFKSIFLFAFIPSCVAMMAIYFIRETKSESSSTRPKISIQATREFFQQSSIKYKQLLFLFGLFSLFNSSDMFLILALKEKGLSTTSTILHYIVFNLSFVLLSWPIGILSDKMDRMKIVLIGFVLFAITYFLLAFSNASIFTYFAFAIYGIYNASTDGISKAIVGKEISSNHKATALGLLGMIQSIMMLMSSIIAGVLWSRYDYKVALLFSAIGTVATALIFAWYYFASLKNETGS